MAAPSVAENVPEVGETMVSCPSSPVIAAVVQSLSEFGTILKKRAPSAAE